MGLSASHLPTLLLLIGYPVYWLEMTFRPGAHTSPFAAFLFFSISGIGLLRSFAPQWKPAMVDLDAWDWAWLAGGGVILTISFLAALQPPHLTQEYDALNYHYALPRQHLIIGSFSHLPWSTADLWLMPIQYALAPYWFATPLPGKWPQFLFLIGLLGVILSLMRQWTSSAKAARVAAVAILASHGFGIQFGTAMLDIPMLYLALAGLESLYRGNAALAAIEWGFLAWAKPFSPLQWGAVAVLMGLGWFAARRFRREMADSPERAATKKAVFWGVIVSVVLAGPFVLKSMRYAGTPLYPFAPFAFGGSLSSYGSLRDAFTRAALDHASVQHSYGYGRDLLSFVFHFWRIAVPSHGVNNAYDYPIGLPYLMCLGPLLVVGIRQWRDGRISWMLLCVGALWTVWFAGSQQSRWLYLPIALIFLLTIREPWVFENRLFKLGLLTGLGLSCLSLARSHAGDLRAFSLSRMRLQDAEVLQRSRQAAPSPLVLPHQEAAFAETLVHPAKGWPWVVPEASPRSPI